MLNPSVSRWTHVGIIIWFALASLTVIACDDEGGGGGEDTLDADVLADMTGDTDDSDSSTDTLMPDTADTSVAETDAADAGDTSTDGRDGTDATDMSDMPPVTGERVVCENTFTPPASGVCEVTAGSGAVLLEGTVLAGNTIYENGTVLLDSMGPNATITCVGCDCADQASASGATRVTCAEGVISPGLINPHDHITFDLSWPQSWDPERFEHRHDWRLGIRGHSEVDTNPGRDSSAEAVLWAELRMLMGGATSIAGSGGADGLLRNLDRSSQLEGLSGIDVDYRTFPLGDTGGQLSDTDCDYPSIDFGSRAESAGIYLPHIAEGIDPEAENEFRCASDATAGEDLVRDNTSIIHAIGLTGVDMQLVADRGAQIVWSPRSNVSLYGDTARVTAFRNLGVTIALGTDWSASGSMNLLRELQCADFLNANHFNNAFSDLELWRMVTRGAATAMGAATQIGVIKEGWTADISIFDARERNDYAAIIGADVDDVVLVMRGGEPLYGAEGVVSTMRGGMTGCESMDVCGRTSALCVQADAGFTVAQLDAATASGKYPLFFCNRPDNEPTCVPSRPGDPALGDADRGYTGMTMMDDRDGDGILNSEDNCPDIFNPIRRLDGMSQPDADGDGLGDACDPCILSTTDQCTPADPNDRDNDGIDDIEDVCPSLPNPDQIDTDDDGKGDLCDDCPGYSNPGAAGCLVTVYDIKQGTTGEGSVRLENVVVTAVNDGEGIFVQVPEDSADYDGAEYSGIYMFMRNYADPFPQRGDCLTIEADVQDWFGQWQLSGLRELTIDSSCTSAVPPPVAIADPSTIATTGAQRENYEGVLVTVSNVTVSELNPPAGPGESDPTNAFIVTGGLQVDDFFHMVSPFPTVGQEFAAITGVLRWANDRSKLEPRDESDLGPPSLIAFDPQRVLLEVGSTVDVDVCLSAPAEMPTDVTLSYMPASPPELMSPPSMVTIPMGMTCTTLTLTGAQSNTTEVAVTATYDGVSESFDVRVYDDTEARSLLSLEPDPATISVGSSETFTVTIDLPARSTGETVTLSASPDMYIGLPMPAEVTIPPGATQATFEIDGTSEGTGEVVTATLGTSMATTNIDVISRVLVGMIFSEYVEGSSNNKAIEIYNGTGAAVDLSTCTINRYNNGSSSTTDSMTLSGTLADDDTWVICHTSFDAAAASTYCDEQDTAATNFNGNDALELVCNGSLEDAFGQVGMDPGSQWEANGVGTQDQTLRRKCTITDGDSDSGDAFDPSVEWDTYPQDTFDDLGQWVCN